MTWIGYCIKAKTLYNIHSPFVFDMYQNVLFARVRSGLKARTDGHSRRFGELRYKLMDYYSLKEVQADDHTALLAGGDDIGSILIVDRPHASKEAEQRWAALCGDERYRVSIDIYRVGLLLTNRHLHREHFLLK